MRNHARSVAVAVGLGVVGLLGGPRVSTGQDDFTIVAIPDTQFYSQSTLGPGQNFFDVQTRWIVDNAAARKIVFASHMGDVVDVAGPVGVPQLDEWDDAVRAMATLRGSSLPHGILPGNHDWTSSAGEGSIEHYRARFGDTSGYFDGKAWFLGFDPRGVNSAQRFDTPLGPMLHLSLEWNFAIPAASSDRPGAPTDAIAWAQGMLDAHPGMPTIVSTHNNVNASSIKDGAGNALFEKLVRKNDQIFLVLNGHYHGEGRIDSTNDRGRVVYEICNDYQSRNRGGDGWLRLFEFRPLQNSIQVRTYTPISDAVNGIAAGVEFGNIGRLETDADSQFELPLDFAERFGPPPESPSRGRGPRAGAAITFRRLLDGYAGVEDTEVRSSNPSGYLGVQQYMHIDTDDTAGGGAAGPSCGLIKFGGLFGSGTRQVADDRDVLEARLRLYVHEDRSNSEGSGFELRRMLVGWTSLTTWNMLTMGGSHAGSPPGIGPFGSSGWEANGRPDGYAGGNVSSVGVFAGRSLDIDVTRTVRVWKNGQANNGWVIQPFANNTNGVRIETSESGLAGVRWPELVITPTKGVVKTVEFVQVVDTRLDETNPDTSFAGIGTLVIDAAVEDNLDPAGSDVQGLVRFTNVFGTAANQVPPGARVSSAVLVLHVNANIANHPGTGFSVHQMLRQWSDSTTWNASSIGGDGVQADNVDSAAIADDVAGVGVVAGELNVSAVQAGDLWLDVTQSVRAWSENGGNDANFGWALLPTNYGTNGVFVDSFEATHAGARPPRLVVRFACGADFDGSGSVDVPDIFAYLNAWFALEPDANYDGRGDMTIQDIFTFLNDWFGGCV